MNEFTWLMASLWLVLLVVSIKWRESQILKGVAALLGLFFGLIVTGENAIPGFLLLGFNFYWLAMAVLDQKGL